jgi:hypothetical protein
VAAPTCAAIPTGLRPPPELLHVKNRPRSRDRDSRPSRSVDRGSGGASRLQHSLRRAAGADFDRKWCLFGPIPWKNRACGACQTSPIPPPYYTHTRDLSVSHPIDPISYQEPTFLHHLETTVTSTVTAPFVSVTTVTYYRYARGSVGARSVGRKLGRPTDRNPGPKPDVQQLWRRAQPC